MAQILEIVRGTTNTFEVGVTDAAGLPYNLGPGEKIIFGVKKNPDVKEEPLLIVKTAEILYEGLYSVRLCPEDTIDMDLGRYYYDVALDNGTDFFPVVPCSPLILAANVTRRGCADA